MRKTLATFAVVALALAGCGTTGEDEATVSNTPAPAQASEENGYQLEKLAIGDAAHLTNSVNGPRDVNVTVTDVKISTECNDRQGDYTGMDKDGYYVQVAMHIDVKQEQSEFTAPQFTFAKEGGEVLDATSAMDCTRDYQNNMFHPGQNGDYIDEYWMPEVPAGAVLSIPGEPVTYAWMLDDVKVDEAPAGDDPAEAEPAANASNAQQVEGPTFLKCQMADGTALMSDGTTTYLDTCDEYAGGPPRLADGTSIYDQGALSDIPIADGGTCPAYKCGYGHDANGNPNPTSGELQAQDGCAKGYITDPALCGAVAEKLGGY